MRDRLLTLCLVTLCACSTGSPAGKTHSDPTEQSATEFVIEPLVPRQELPPGTDLHYNFVHLILPSIVFGEPPDKVREQFLGPTADEFVRTQWRVIHSEPPTSFPSARRVELEVGQAALVAMPAPQKNAHAYFALIVFKHSGPIRFVTLERSVWMKDDAHDRTVIGEWSIEDGAPVHNNFGEGPGPSEEEFLRGVLDYIR